MGINRSALVVAVALVGLLSMGHSGRSGHRHSWAVQPEVDPPCGRHDDDECFKAADNDQDGDICDDVRQAFYDKVYPTRETATYQVDISSLVSGANIIGEIGDLSGRQIIPGTIRIYDESTTPQVITDVGTVVNSVGALTGDLGAASTTQHTDADLGTCSNVSNDTVCSTELTGTGSLVTPVVWDSLSMTVNGAKTFVFDSLFTDTGGVSGLSLESTDADFKNLVIFGEFGVNWVTGTSEWSDDTARGVGVPLTATYQSGVDNRMGYEFGGEAINASFAAPAVGAVTFEYEAHLASRNPEVDEFHVYFPDWSTDPIPCLSPLAMCGVDRGDVPIDQALPDCSGGPGAAFPVDSQDLPHIHLHFAPQTTLACDLPSVAGRWGCIHVGDAANDGSRVAGAAYLIPFSITGDPVLTMADTDSFAAGQAFTGLWLDGVKDSGVEMTIRELSSASIAVGAVIVGPDNDITLDVETESGSTVPMVLLDGRIDGTKLTGRGGEVVVGHGGVRSAPVDTLQTWGDGSGCRYGGATNGDDHNCRDFAVVWDGEKVNLSEFQGVSQVSGRLAAASDECVEFSVVLPEDGANVDGTVVIDAVCDSSSTLGHVRVHSQQGNYECCGGANPNPKKLDGLIVVTGAFDTDGASEFAMGMDDGRLSGDSEAFDPGWNLRMQDRGIAAVDGRRYRENPAGSGVTHSGKTIIPGAVVHTFELDSLAAPGVGTTRCLPWGDRNAAFVDCAAPEAKLTSSEALFLNRWRLELLSDVASTNELCEITPLCDGSPVDDGWTAQSVHVSQVGGPGLRNQGDVEEFWLAEYCSDGKVLTLEVEEPGVRGSATACEVGSSCDCTTLDALIEVETARFPR